MTNTKIYAEEILLDKEMEKVSGGMTTPEWDAYNKHYDKAMIRAQMAGDKDLLAKLTKKRPKLPDDYRPMDTFLKKYDLSASGKHPYTDWKLEDMPNLELVYKMGGRKA